MSRIYFHSKSDDEAEIFGSERHYMGGNANALAWGFVHSASYFHMDRILSFLPESHHRNWNRLDKERSLYHFIVGGIREVGHMVLPDGRKIDPWHMCLNTALAVGSDPMKLSARIHAQCECHCWVDGPNREWLADIIDEGLTTGLFREGLKDHDQGWDSVLELLRKRDDEAIVTSFSVCDGFPNMELCNWDYQREKEYYALDYKTQWAIAEKNLRESEMGLELTPEEWDYPEYYIGNHAFTALDLHKLVVDIEHREEEDRERKKRSVGA